ncbi:unnamed protein product [Symbiodinium necroappetens]|uniref:Probable pectate lyase C n=1 Tax=Symbiodinium necroappetens TaxID=1628268 RepID=A0A812PPZ4_9DINO|nr:unnamed protein product [Symbiodinium necroappetens]
MQNRATLALIAFGLTPSLCAHAATITVDDDGPADFSSIQAAINASADGDEIIVMPGTYFEHLTMLGKAITLRGSDPSSANTVAMTMIDGQQAGVVIRCENGEGPGTVIEGLNIRNGEFATGGGFRIVGASPTIRDCQIEENRSPRGGGAYLFDGSDTTFERCVFRNNLGRQPDTFGPEGGGVYMEQECSPTFTECDFDMNRSSNGDAVGIGGAVAAVDTCTPSFVDCNFFANEARSTAGAIYLSNGGGLTATRCVFFDNEGNTNGGAIYLEATEEVSMIEGCEFLDSIGPALGLRDAFAEVRSSRFEGNRTPFSGAAINAFGAAIHGVTVTDTVFISNLSGLSGGAIRYSGTGTCTLENCTLRNNDTDGFGGAVTILEGTLKVTNCVFENNSAADPGGGAIYVDDATAQILSSVFDGNTAQRPNGVPIFARGGAVCNNAGEVEIVNGLLIRNLGDSGSAVHTTSAEDTTLINCTVADSVDPNFFMVPAMVRLGVGALRLRNTILWNPALDVEIEGVGDVEFSLVRNGAPGMGNISGDPLFVSPALGDYSLASSSPAIDAGDASVVPGDVLTDIEGEDRIVNGQVDMGAFENQGSVVCLGDCDNSGSVDFNDLVAMLFEFGNGGVECDADGSGSVDFNDLVAALFLFGACP